MIDRIDPELTRIRCEAMDYADRHGMNQAHELVLVEQSMRQKAFMRATQPLRDAKVRVYLAATSHLPYQVVMRDDGSIEPPELPKLDGAAAMTMAMLDEMIASEARRYRLELPE